MTDIWQSPLWPNFICDSTRTELPLARALEAVGEIQGLQAGLEEGDQQQLRLGRIIDEALASFSIEGVSLNAAEIEASVIASLRHRNQAPPSRRPDAIAELMLEARDYQGPLDEPALFAWHNLLFYGVEIEDRGRWRSFELEIVRSAQAARQDEVLYRAPPPERLEGEMAAFLAWLARPADSHPAIRAALAHLWFESIHPFSDGNGRIGRAIIDHVFARERALPFSLSRQIEREKKAYYEALQAGRREGQGGIDATPFVEWFLHCLLRAAEASRKEALFLTRRNAFFTRFGPVLNARQEKALRLLFAQGPERLAEGISARSWRRMTGAASATASRDLAGLAEAGILTQGEGAGRSTLWHLTA